MTTNKPTLAALFLLACSISHAASYYVSPAGDDAKDGRTEATAWRTCAKVNKAAFQPGDSILFKRGGEWREQLGHLPAVIGYPEAEPCATRVLQKAVLHRSPGHAVGHGDLVDVLLESVAAVFQLTADVFGVVGFGVAVLEVAQRGTVFRAE